MIGADLRWTVEVTRLDPWWRRHGRYRLQFFDEAGRPAWLLYVHGRRAALRKARHKIESLNGET